MSGYNGDAYLQRHRGEHPLPPLGDRVLCPCQCGRILSRQWHIEIFGYEPKMHRPAVQRYIDPSDELGYNVEHRSAS